MVTSSSAVVRYYIALRLAQLRDGSGLTKQQAGKRIGRTGQMIANLEKAANAPSQSDLERLLEIYGAADQIPEMRALLPIARKRTPKRAAPIPEDYDLRLNLEVDMARLDVVETSLVPGLLQTPDYAEAVFRAYPNRSDDEIKQLVAGRMERKEIFTRTERPVELHVVLDESVLRRPRGDADVMAEQLDYLLEVARIGTVDLQVLPLDAGAYQGQGNSWTIMTFPVALQEHPGLVYLDLLGEARYMDDPDAVERYRRAWRHVLGAALSADRSLQLIRKVRKTYGDKR
ncbi:helix-turn-helix transcriptional regulator [Saccharopolyspora shandongensis]|uniref:helix-turn-helix domain-containing protein n=1 Tax=Saccharopolyspora shandongensis TaxID=418495 RepID=UPI00342BA03B